MILIESVTSSQEKRRKDKYTGLRGIRNITEIIDAHSITLFPSGSKQEHCCLTISSLLKCCSSMATDVFDTCMYVTIVIQNILYNYRYTKSSAWSRTDTEV